jgi:hypothetical protein
MLYRVQFNRCPDPSARVVHGPAAEAAQRDVHWRSVRSIRIIAATRPAFINNAAYLTPRAKLHGAPRRGSCEYPRVLICFIAFVYPLDLNPSARVVYGPAAEAAQRDVHWRP